MFQHLLVAIDGSESSLHAADIAIDLATVLQANLDLLSVEETPPRYVSTQEELSREHSAAVMYYDRLQRPLRQRAERRGIQTRCAIVNGHEGQAIMQYIEEQRCDLLLLGYEGHSGVWGAFLGSTADKLVSHVPCSVLIVRSQAAKALFKHLLVALDGSPFGWQAFQVGVQLAKVLGATLGIISVIEGPVVPSANRASTSQTSTVSQGINWDWTTYFQQVQKLATAQAQLTGMAIETLLREGHASGVLTAAAQQGNYDLLILGATGHEHPWSPTSGGTARKVANEVPCAVLLVRPSGSTRKVRDLMTARPVTVTLQTPLSAVIDQLIEHNVKMLVVVDEEQHVQGIVTLGHLLTHGDTFRHLDVQRVVTTTHLSQHVEQVFTSGKIAADVMIKHPFVVKDDTSMEAAARWMISQPVTRMPVVDADQRLVGVLDQATLLRYYTDLPEAADNVSVEEEIQQVARPQVVGETVLFQVPRVASGTPFVEVLRKVQETPYRRVIVVKSDGTALGMIGDRDLLASQGLASQHNPILALAGRLSLRLPEDLFRHRMLPKALTAQQLMRSRLFSVIRSTTMAEAIRLMLTNRIKRLVVVDEAGKPLGLVDRQQLLRCLVEGGALPGEEQQR